MAPEKSRSLMRRRASAKASRLSVIWAAVVAVLVVFVFMRKGLDWLGEEAAGWLLWVISMGEL